VIITLPCCAPPSEVPSQAWQKAGPSGQGELILVVEDGAGPADQHQIKRIAAWAKKDHDSGFQTRIFCVLVNHLAGPGMRGHGQLSSKPGLFRLQPLFHSFNPFCIVHHSNLYFD
jgi:hypothetical protein